VKKLIKIILKYPLKLINYIYTYFYYKNNSIGKSYNAQDMLIENGKVLVLSPHVDDETIGLGATLFKHKKMDSEMSLVYMTDGGGSTTDTSREELIAIRKAEGEKVKETYGFKSLYFLDEIDGELDFNKEDLIDKIVNILEIEKPNIIYTPFLIDGHRDHVATTKALISALKTWNKNFENIYMYEINSPIKPELINSINPMDKKDYVKKGEVYNIFDSQWAMDFNAFRLMDRRKGYLIENTYGAEIFVKADLESLIEMEETLENEGFKPEQFRQLSSHYNLLFAFRSNKELKEKYNEKVSDILEKSYAKEK
jgi:LmbE family N-acetylglucosaminyl deacetylase